NPLGMRLAALLITAAIAAFAATADPPAEVRVTNNEGSLSYQVINNSRYRIVSFELFTSWRQGDVYGSCAFQQPKVKSDADLTARDVCVLPSTGGAINSLRATIRSLRFSSGMTWLPPVSGN